VVAYQDVFINQWAAEYKPRFHIWNNVDVHAMLMHSSNPPLSLILVTHDELTFYQNDERKTY
jgi:hypothetical protein